MIDCHVMACSPLPQQHLQQFLSSTIWVNSGARPAGHPTVKIDADGGDGGVGMGMGALHFQSQADGIPAGAGSTPSQRVDSIPAACRNDFGIVTKLNDQISAE